MLSTPRTRCESRVNREQLELLATRRSYKRRRALTTSGPLFIVVWTVLANPAESVLAQLSGLTTTFLSGIE